MISTILDAPRPIIIDRPYTDEAILALKAEIKARPIRTSDYTLCKITYATRDMQGCVAFYGDPSVRPIKITGGLTAGYGGTGPHGTVEALKLLGFRLTEAVEDLVYSKAPVDDAEVYRLQVRKEKGGVTTSF